jgi:hypothetical protein
MKGRMTSWIVVGLCLLLLALATPLTGCALNKYDEDGNLIEQWTPPSVEELIAYIELAERLEPLFTRLFEGTATEKDKNTVDKLLEYYRSPEGQKAAQNASDRTIAMLMALQRLRMERGK